MFKFAYSIHQKAPQAWPTFASTQVDDRRAERAEVATGWSI